MALETLKNEMMKNFSSGFLLKSLLIAGVLFLVYSCFAPANKEVYLEKFEQFIEKVEKGHEQYTADDWQWADKRYKKFSGEWYRKFKGEYTLEDQIRIKGLIVTYKMLKGNMDTNSTLNDLFREDLDDFKKRLDDYLENDADEDLEKLKEEAEKMGDSAIRLLDEVLRDLEEK